MSGPRSFLTRTVEVVGGAALTVAALVASPAAAHGADDPTTVVNRLLAAENAHDVDTAVAQFGPGAVVTLPVGVYDTPAKIRAWQDELATGHFDEQHGPLTVKGDHVTFDGSVALDSFRQLGLARLSSHWDIAVVNGQVTTFDFTFTPESLAALAKASAAATSAVPFTGDRTGELGRDGILLVLSGVSLIALSRRRGRGRHRGGRVAI